MISRRSQRRFRTELTHKMGAFFNDVFLPTMKKLVGAGLSYDEVKRVVNISTTWDAKISGEQFREQVAELLAK